MPHFLSRPNFRMETQPNRLSTTSSTPSGLGPPSHGAVVTSILPQPSATRTEHPPSSSEHPASTSNLRPTLNTDVTQCRVHQQRRNLRSHRRQGHGRPKENFVLVEMIPHSQKYLVQRLRLYQCQFCLASAASSRQTPPPSTPNGSAVVVNPNNDNANVTSTSGSTSKRTGPTSPRDNYLHSTVTTSPVHRVFRGRTLPIPHAKARLAHQLKYIENLAVTDLAPRSAALRKILMDLLHLQLKIPTTARLHLLLESDNTSESSKTMSTFDLYSLFSTTISTETKSCRETVSELG